MKKITDLAHIFQATVAPHICGGPFTHVASVHLEAAMPNFILHEHHVQLVNKDNSRYGLYEYEAKDSYVTIPELPGLGQELSEFALKTLDKITIKGQ